MKTKRLIALFVVVAMMFTFVATIAACDKTHKCNDKCPTCQKCLTDCDDPACADKCPGHDGEDHECESKCPDCGKCLNKSCQEEACKNKCPGHDVVDDHECNNFCATCGGCLTADCGHKDCEIKCEKGGVHGEIVAEITVTFVVGTYGQLKGEASNTAETVNGKLAALPEVEILADYEATATFIGWFTEATGGEEVTVDTYFAQVEEEEPDPVNVYAQYKKEWTVTLNALTGTLDPEAQKTYVTVDGKLPEGTVLPEVQTADHFQFKGWYTAQTDGTLVIEEEHVFTADTTIYARIVREDGVWIGSNGATFLASLTRNTGNTTNVEYWLGDGVTVSLTLNQVLTIWISGKQCTGMWITGAGVKELQTNANQVTVTKAGDFKIFLKDYSTPSKPVDWGCEFRTSTPVIVGDESAIPADADAFKVKLGSLEEITFYLQTSTGAGVKSTSFSSYCIYTFENEAFGDWTGSTTKGRVQETITSTAVTSVPVGWIFRWGASYNTQTANIENAIEAGGTYVIKLPSASNGQATVTKIVKSAD